MAYTWLSPFHNILDIQRGLFGDKFLSQLKEENFGLYNKLIQINNQIELICKPK